MPTSFRCTLFLLLVFLLPMSSQGEVIDWPLATENSEGELIPGYRTYIQQKFAHDNATHGGPHAGIDLQYRDPDGGDFGLYSIGKAVYAAADGRVVFADPKAIHYPGDVVLIEHQDNSGGSFYSQYGHLSNISVQKGEEVQRGDQIGEIYDDGDNSHLHFEIRDFRVDPWKQTFWGPGYGPYGSDPKEFGWFDPVDYYYTHRRSCTGPALHDADHTLKIRDRPTVTGPLLAELPIGTEIHVEDVVPDSEDNGYWWFKVAYTAKGELHHGFAGAHAELPDQPALINLAQVHRSCEQMLPGITHLVDGWDTRLFLRNNNPETVDAVVKIYESDGSRVFFRLYVLDPNESVEVEPNASIQEGTAVALVLGDSEATEGLSIVARNRIFQSGDDVFASFEPVRYAPSKQTVPVVHRANYGWYNDIYMFNPDRDKTVTVELEFSDYRGSSWCDEVPTIGPRETLVLDTSTWDGTCMSDGYAGTLTLISKDADGNPAPLAVTTRQENRQTGGILASLAVSGITRSAAKLFMPMIHNKNWGYEAGVGLALNGGDGNVTAIYFPPEGLEQCHDEPLYGEPVIEPLLPVDQGTTCPSILSTHLEGSDNAQLFAQFNQLFRGRDDDEGTGQNDEENSETTSVPAESHPNYRAYVPYLQPGALRGIQVQNTENEPATFTVSYYAQNGDEIETDSYSVGEFGVQSIVQDIPEDAYNAAVTSTTKIAVIVNNLVYHGDRDDLMDYLAPLSYD